MLAFAENLSRDADFDFAEVGLNHLMNHIFAPLLCPLLVDNLAWNVKPLQIREPDHAVPCTSSRFVNTWHRFARNHPSRISKHLAGSLPARSRSVEKSVAKAGALLCPTPKADLHLFLPSVGHEGHTKAHTPRVGAGPDNVQTGALNAFAMRRG
jgi:hypothetical protein